MTIVGIVLGYTALSVVLGIFLGKCIKFGNGNEENRLD